MKTAADGWQEFQIKAEVIPSTNPRAPGFQVRGPGTNGQFVTSFEDTPLKAKKRIYEYAIEGRYNKD